MKERVKYSKENTIGIVVKKDRGEKEFSHLVRDWVAGDISDDTLMRNLPSHNLTTPQRILRFLSEKIS